MQLPLNIHLSEVNRFSNFISGQNEELVTSLEDNIVSLSADAKPGVEILFIWGGAGAGKTHYIENQKERGLNLFIRFF